MADEQKRPAPPYIAFQTLKTLITNMKADGIPGRVDKTMLRNFSGAVASQLITALKFLGLTDDAGLPTTTLRKLVTAWGTPHWPVELSGALKTAFAPIFTLDLQTATPGQFTEKFADSFDGEGDTLRKAITFFVNAVREAEIPISSYIMKNKKPRASNGKKKARAKADPKNDSKSDAKDYAGKDTPPLHAVVKLPSETLLGLFEADMGHEEKSAIWTLIQFFKERGK
ncbi:MAG: hypothetical protein JWN16_1137 [Alphaproteobacteria bacterium]|nr:hypothetical protein [Alphaproteobacteria bacterium]